MALSSPGVQVSVIDESFYTPSEPGTVPLIVIATAANKQNGAGTGVATGTLASNADTLYLMTSQRDLVDTFGDAVFKTDASNNPIHGGEQNEYGLQAAYSYLGVSNRAFVLRANVDLAQLDATATAPSANPANGTWWLDTSNTKWGIFEWNSDVATVGGNGQKFINKVPLVITDTTKVVDFAGQDYTPKGSVGAVGAYAVVAVTTTLAVYYKNRSGIWVQVGSPAWAQSWPTIAATGTGPVSGVIQFIVDGETFSTPSLSSATLLDTASAINSIAGLNTSGVFAAVVNSKLEIYSNNALSDDSQDSAITNTITISNGTGTPLASLGLGTGGNYLVPRLSIQPHTTVPEYKRSDSPTTVIGRPTGSVWIKSTIPNLGANLVAKRYNSATDAWETVAAPVYANGAAALAALDPTGGGANLAVGALYSKFNIEEDFGLDLTPRLATFKLFRRNAVGATTITSAAVTTSTFTAGTNRFVIAESLIGDDAYSSDATVTFTANANIDDADEFANAVNAAGLINVTASVDSSNRIVITHATGGDILIGEGTNAPFGSIFNPGGVTPTANLYVAATGDAAHDYVATQWRALSFEASPTEVTALAEDQQLWYNSIVDEVDILINDGTNWVGYENYPGYSGTDPAGPIVSASEPTTQNDGTTALANGDLWIDTSDIDNYPVIYKFNSSLPANNQWVLIDKTDQSSEDGVLFADARYNTSGVNSDEPGLIADLLVSDYVDPDCPQPALYPKGMLLWNLRRSGFNVKKFVRNYIDLAAYNTLVGPAPGQYMSAYYPHRWVSEAANQVDGSGTFGRKAQRAVVIQGLQAVVNSNQTVRDSDSRVFNLIACPGYPELIGELITLNYDRGLTAFVVADTPARLDSSATSLLAWGNNDNGSAQDDDLGAVSFDEYAAMYYPWGFSSDNFGNNIVVPPSHMMLRTISLNDQVAYPWFAPAGTRRGGITNATSVGYVTSEGEFETVALNEGQRDTLASIKVNPLTFLSGAGLVAFGQYTRARNASALDRVNVARLIVYLRRQLNLLAKPYLFEPNDRGTRAEIKNAVESLMLELVGQRALYDFLVVCDESNNTPARIDRNELYVDIAIEPIKAVEFIYIPLRIKNTGEISGL
jgi:hypothetical protein